MSAIVTSPHQFQFGSPLPRHFNDLDAQTLNPEDYPGFRMPEIKKSLAHLSSFGSTKPSANFERQETFGKSSFEENKLSKTHGSKAVSSQANLDGSFEFNDDCLTPKTARTSLQKAFEISKSQVFIKSTKNIKITSRRLLCPQGADWLESKIRNKRAKMSLIKENNEKKINQEETINQRSKRLEQDRSHQSKNAKITQRKIIGRKPRNDSAKNSDQTTQEASHQKSISTKPLAFVNPEKCNPELIQKMTDFSEKMGSFLARFARKSHKNLNLTRVNLL